MLRNIFHTTDCIFSLNGLAGTNRKYTIPLNKLRKGDAAWSKWYTILIWYIDTEAHLLCLTKSRAEKVRNVLHVIPASVHNCLLRNWWRLLGLLGLLQSIMLMFEGSQGMLTRLQHFMYAVKGKHVQLTAAVHDKIHMLVCILAILESRLTHLHGITPFPPSWFGTTYASGTVMGCVFRDNSGKWFVRRAPFCRHAGLPCLDGNYQVITLFSTWQWKFTITLREYGELSLPPIYCIT